MKSKQEMFGQPRSQVAWERGWNMNMNVEANRKRVTGTDVYNVMS